MCALPTSCFILNAKTKKNAKFSGNSAKLAILFTALTAYQSNSLVTPSNWFQIGFKLSAAHAQGTGFCSF